MTEKLLEQFHLEQMPPDELKELARKLMVNVPDSAAPAVRAAAVRRQLTVIEGLDRQALLEIVVWARHPVVRSADKLELVREIAAITFVTYEGLGQAPLSALARLRGLNVPDHATEEDLRALLRRGDGLKGWFARKRRAVVAGVVGKLLDLGDDNKDEYQFLPERTNDASLRRQIEQQGVVGGIASKLRSAADVYIEAKLDEIERRIDRKLDEIDQRLAEWRDREIANRLKIVKITLVATIIIAAASLIYNWIRMHM